MKKLVWAYISHTYTGDEERNKDANPLLFE